MTRFTAPITGQPVNPVNGQLPTRQLSEMRLSLALVVFATAWVLALLDIDPVPTWFYVVAWYPTLVVLDEMGVRLGGRAPLLRGWRRLASLFGWSAVIWLLFEAANFRLANWYYVFVPRHPVERWVGILVSFATVVPAIVLMARLVDVGSGRRALRSAPLPYPAGQRWVPVGLGLLMGGLALAQPVTFFPLIWGAAWLACEPFVYRRRPDLSLFADLERGDWRRTVNLLVGGLAVGFLWELYNSVARGRWIYTVPWLEELKLFEMPPLGFLGFPFFALEAWAMYAALVCLGLASETEKGGASRAEEAGRWVAPAAPAAPLAPAVRSAGARAIAAAFVIVVMLGIERWTISSVVPRMADLPGVAHPERFDALGLSPFDVARLDVERVQQRTGLSRPAAARAIDVAHLVLLRGLGARHATRLQTLGIQSVCALAPADWRILWAAYHGRSLDDAAGFRGGPAARPTPPEVRVWIRAARSACEQR